MARKRMSFDEMRNDGREPERTNGVICKNCGAGNLEPSNTGRLPSGTITRYRYCRNCGKRYETRQQPEQITREVKPHKADDEDEGPPTLKVRTA